jgi:hypothetical protein
VRLHELDLNLDHVLGEQLMCLSLDNDETGRQTGPGAPGTGMVDSRGTYAGIALEASTTLGINSRAFWIELQIATSRSP